MAARSLQALWRIIYPLLLDEIARTDSDLHKTLLNIDPDPRKCVADLSYKISEVFQQLESFVTKNATVSENFRFWWSYLEMVSVLLMFVRSMRDGDWDLYLSSISLMLPYIARYDHLNYLKSLTVYIAEMNMIPESVKKSFRDGNFVVKESEEQFSQVDADHAQEWLVNTVKSAGGLKGITNEEPPLMRWALSFHLRSYLTERTFEMFDMNHSSNNHNELTPSRCKRETFDENNLLALFKECNIFTLQVDTPLQNVLTKDVAPENIKVSLLTAKKLGQEQVKKFVSDRLIMEESGKTKVSFNDPVKKNGALTFRDLLKKPTQKPVKQIRAVDRNIMQRIIFAYEAGRPVDLYSILHYELFNVPVALAEANGVMRSGDKSSLMNHLISDVNCSSSLKYQPKSHLLIDAQAMIQAMGRPIHLQTFADMAEYIGKSLKKRCENYDRVDVVFDRYVDNSIKSATRKKRSSGLTPIRRIIENRNVPLPKNWSNFLALSENKADFAKFLSAELTDLDVGDTELVLSGGFSEVTEVFSSRRPNILELQSNHEEADTRIIVHAASSSYEIVVVSARDTDVFLLLLYHYEKFNCKELWMMSGTAKSPKYVPIHDVHRKIEKALVKSLLAYHAVTGCDVTSFISGITKKAGFATLASNANLLSDLGKVPLADTTIKKVEKFVLRLYKIGPEIKTADAARYSLFGKKKSAEAMPPTTDALHLHIKRAHYQTYIWENAHIAKLELPDLTDCGWKIFETNIMPVWTTLGPVPEEAISLAYCGCLSKCHTNMCSCRKRGFSCTRLCKCSQLCLNKAE